jgi:predicted O-methyltransferase YrrM
VISLRHLPYHAITLLRSLPQDGLDFVRLWLRVRSSVPGWLSGEDARLLYGLARRGPGRGAVVEIGSAWGRSTIMLAHGSKRAHREKVVAIDPHTGDPRYLDADARQAAPPSAAAPGTLHPPPGPQQFSSLPAFQANLRRFGVDDWVVPVVALSSEAARTLPVTPIRLLFIDGLHSYEGVQTDIADWLPRVIAGGMVVFDDYFNDKPEVGVRAAVDELRASGAIDPKLGRGGVLVWVRKR